MNGLKKKKNKTGKQGIMFLLLLFIPLLRIPAQAGNDPLVYLNQRFQAYCRAVPWEEVYMHTDRDEYVAGEDLWFSAYLINRQNMKASEHSRVIYVELMNPVNVAVVQQKVLLNEAAGHGYMRLADTLPPGTYTLRAYTRWMQNFFPVNCFTRDISIYGSQASARFYRKEQILGKRSRSNYYPAGIGFEVTAGVMNNGDVDISVTAQKSPSQAGNNQLWFFIQSHGNALSSGSLRLAGGSARAVVPGNKLIAGICQITVFDNFYRPLCDRFIYIPPGVSRTIAGPEVREKYDTREKVSAEFQVGRSGAASEGSSLSMSVAQVTGKALFPGIDEYLLFGTEFGPNPVNYILKGRRPADLAGEEMQELLNSLESNWIDWDKILAYSGLRFEFQPEASEISLPFRLVDINNWPAYRDEVATMSFPGKTAGFQYGITDENGFFNFILPVDGREKDLVLQPDNTPEDYRIIPQSPFSDDIPLTRMTIDTISAEPACISKWRTNIQISKVYETSWTGEFSRPDTSHAFFKRFYGKPDFTINLADYVSLPLMEEIFFELIPRVKMKADRSKYEIIVLDPAGNPMYDEPPVMMIDGVPVKDASLIAELNPEVVEKIDVVYGTWVVDAYIFHGIINVITKPADFSSVPLPANALRILYRVAEPVPEFISPDYFDQEKLKNRIPDFRNTMYWNPSLKTDRDGKAQIAFWTSDYAGEYMIDIQGLTGDGRIVSVRKLSRTENRHSR